MSKIKELERIVDTLDKSNARLRRRIEKLEKDCYIDTYYPWHELGEKLGPKRFMGMVLHHFRLTINHHPSKDIWEMVEDETSEDKEP